MTAPQQHPHLVKVRYGTVTQVLYFVAGGLFLLLGLLSLVGGYFSIYLILGPLLVVAGILSFVNPYCRYDTATGTMQLLSPLGFAVRTFGAPKGERIYFHAATGKVMRALPNGTQRKVSMFGVNNEELGRLVAVLPHA